MEEKDKTITEADLAAAFKPEKKKKQPKKPKNKKKIWSIAIFIIGLIVLIIGAVLLFLRFFSTPGLQDGEYLVSAKEWVLEDEKINCQAEESEESTANCESNQVIWQFTEIGKGKLTTNNHINDYDFIWAIDNGKLKIETKWLYDLENEYEYKLGQGNGILTLYDKDNEMKFIANFATE